jgi:hypothetical protein
MKGFTLDTVTVREEKLIGKLEGLFLGSKFYDENRWIYDGTGPRVDRRRGEICMHLDRDRCYTATGVQLRVRVSRQIDRLVAELNDAFADDGVGVVYSVDRYHNLSIRLTRYHTAVRKTIPSRFGKGGLGDWTRKVTRLAEIIDMFYHMETRVDPFSVKFMLKTSGKVLKETYPLRINIINLTSRNYGAQVCQEASRLLKICDDISDYDAFEPNCGRIVAEDTRDEYDFEL